MEITFPANNLNASTEAFLTELKAHADIGHPLGSLHYRGRAVGYVTTLGVVTTKTDEFTTIPVTRDWKFTAFEIITKLPGVWCEATPYPSASYLHLCTPIKYPSGYVGVAHVGKVHNDGRIARCGAGNDFGRIAFAFIFIEEEEIVEEPHPERPQPPNYATIPGFQYGKK